MSRWGVFGVAFDNTDHVFFVCPRCGDVMEVTDVLVVEVSRKVWLKLRCPSCGYTAARKFYYGEGHRYKPVDARFSAETRCVDERCKYGTVDVLWEDGAQR